MNVGGPGFLCGLVVRGRREDQSVSHWGLAFIMFDAHKWLGKEGFVTPIS